MTSKATAPKQSAKDKKNSSIYFALPMEDKELLDDVMTLEKRKQTDAVSSIVSECLPYRKKMALSRTLPRSVAVGKYHMVFTETLDELKVAINKNGNLQAELCFEKANEEELKNLVTVLLMFANRI